jgi:hypothetical protein
MSANFIPPHFSFSVCHIFLLRFVLHVLIFVRPHDFVYPLYF